MGNEQSAQEGETEVSPSALDGELNSDAKPSRSLDGSILNGDSTTASSPRRGSSGAVPVESSAAALEGKAKVKAKAKPKVKPKYDSKGSGLSSTEEGLNTGSSQQASAPGKEPEGAGLASYLTVSGLRDLFSFQSFGTESQPVPQQGGTGADGENNEAPKQEMSTEPPPASGDAGASDTASGSEGVRAYLTTTLEEVSDMLEKVGADAREGAAAFYEKAKIEAAHASSAASAAASSMVSHSRPGSSQDVTNSKETGSAQAETSLLFSRYFSLGGVSELFSREGSIPKEASSSVTGATNSKAIEPATGEEEASKQKSVPLEQPAPASPSSAGNASVDAPSTNGSETAGHEAGAATSTTGTSQVDVDVSTAGTEPSKPDTEDAKQEIGVPEAKGEDSNLTTETSKPPENVEEASQAEAGAAEVGKTSPIDSGSGQVTRVASQSKRQASRAAGAWKKFAGSGRQSSEVASVAGSAKKA